MCFQVGKGLLTFPTLRDGHPLQRGSKKFPSNKRGVPKELLPEEVYPDSISGGCVRDCGQGKP